MRGLIGENRKVAKEGGSIAGNAREQIEQKTGKKVLTQFKFKPVTRQNELDGEK